MNLNVLLGIDPVESIGDELARRVMQLRRKLGAGGARPDDRDMQLLRAQDVGLRMAADIGVHQAAVEARGLEWRVQPSRIASRTAGAGICALAPHLYHPPVLTEGVHTRALAGFLIHSCAPVDS